MAVKPLFELIQGNVRDVAIVKLFVRQAKLGAKPFQRQFGNARPPEDVVARLPDRGQIIHEGSRPVEDDVPNHAADGSGTRRPCQRWSVRSDLGGRILEVPPRSRSRRKRRAGVPPALPRRKARLSHDEGLASLGRAGETPALRWWRWQDAPANTRGADSKELSRPGTSGDYLLNDDT